MDSNISGDNTDGIGPAEAKKALELVLQAESAGLNLAMPTRSFGIAIALTISSMVTISAYGKTALIALPLAVLGALLATQKNKQGAVLKAVPSGAKGVVPIIGILVFAIALITGAKTLYQAHDYGWAPMAAGFLMAVLVYLLSVLERREYAAKIEAAAKCSTGETT
jgi:hypothetical protein